MGGAEGTGVRGPAAWQWVARQLVTYRSVLTFGVIGVVNTSLHFGTVVALVELFGANPVAANVFGFVLANVGSYFANCYLTFRQAPTWARFRTFAAVSLASLLLAVVLSAFVEMMGWHYAVGLGLILVCGPVMTYLLHKKVTFRKP
jgi:putative flippase GtrA